MKRCCGIPGILDTRQTPDGEHPSALAVLVQAAEMPHAQPCGTSPPPPFRANPSQIPRQNPREPAGLFFRSPP